MTRKSMAFQSLRSVIDEIVHELKPPDYSWFNAIESGWECIVGKVVARYAKPIAVEKDTVVVSVANHTWQTEMRSNEQIILTRLRDTVSPSLRSIRWIVGAADKK